MSLVVPGNVRSVEFSNLRADEHYVLQIYGSSANRRSKIHRVTATTGPEPPTELIFSDVTETSLAVSWTKPNTIFTGFRITYIHTATGKSHFVTVGSQQTHVVLSKLSTGSSYIITVFQRRMNGKTDFYRTWDDYKAGFGNLSEEFWLGNELLHNLTSMGPVSLRVDMTSGNDTAYAHYASFSMASEEKNYTLTVSGYTGTAGDSMKYHNGRPFSARDKEPDPLGIHCARAYMGGWWYKNCYKANLNGVYGSNSNNQGVVWIDWKGKDSSIPLTEMKFRPSRFSPATHG
uniref:Tenascin XB n=1 Tax=Nothobranchius furzeri TaxID=105023 RepID=A0A1A8B078_NOTFU